MLPPFEEAGGRPLRRARRVESGVMYLDQFSSPIILLDLQYPLEADSSEEGIQFAIQFELGTRYIRTVLLTICFIHSS